MQLSGQLDDLLLPLAEYSACFPLLFGNIERSRLKK